MPSARNAILLSIAITVFCIALGVLTLTGDPAPHGRDSFGLRWHGMRALVELLDESGIEVERRLAPPPDEPAPGTYLLWMPDNQLADIEPAYLARLRSWVERGGRLVLAPAPSEASSPYAGLRDKSASFTAILSKLGIEGVRVIQGPSSSYYTYGSTPEERIRHGARRTWDDLQNPGQLSSQDATARPTGTFADSPLRITRLRVPVEGLQRLELDDDLDVLGTVPLELPNEPIVAAAIRRGGGEVIIVAEGLLFMNVALAQADNAALAYDVLAGHGIRRVTIDEFYHGLAVRGNPLWLFTQPLYALAASTALLVAGLVLWRRATPLGPPLDKPPPTRRTVVEYVAATARFFSRSRDAGTFVLDEAYAGVLHELAGRWRVKDAEASPDAIAAALAKRSPAEAERFRQAVAGVEAAQAAGRRGNQAQVIAALQGIRRCLSPLSTK